MSQLDFEGALNPKTVAGPAPEPPPPVTYDFGRMVKAHPFPLTGWRILQIHRADMGYLSLHLTARITLHPLRLVVAINCVTPVDYAIRPKDPAIVDGGMCIEYHEEHEKLRSLCRSVPHSDGLETFDPAIKFALLKMDQSYIIAERFELTILRDGVTNTIFGNAADKDRAVARLQRDLEALEQFRITPTPKRW